MFEKEVVFQRNEPHIVRVEIEEAESVEKDRPGLTKRTTPLLACGPSSERKLDRE